MFSFLFNATQFSCIFQIQGRFEMIFNNMFFHICSLADDSELFMTHGNMCGRTIKFVAIDKN